MPEKFRANDSESGRFWFWKKTVANKKHRRNAKNPAKDIISQANDVVNEFLMESEKNKDFQSSNDGRIIGGILFMGVTVTVFALLVYYLIN